ncbi:MAG: hypothetical protein Q8936_10920 [Bacillota bacterium]|nr:hypothetical protein [Bacillota bacterium]
MKKVINVIGNIAAVGYFIFPMSFVLLLFILMPINFLTDVDAMRTSGFAGQESASTYIALSGFFVGPSLLIPALRKMYRVLPWLYAFVTICFINLVVLSVGDLILYIGYQINNNTRHTIFFILMIVQLVVCRIAMCFYFKRKPIKYSEGK